jgi:hypothetical protein
MHPHRVRNDTAGDAADPGILGELDPEPGDIAGPIILPVDVCQESVVAGPTLEVVTARCRVDGRDMNELPDLERMAA